MSASAASSSRGDEFRLDRWDRNRVRLADILLVGAPPGMDTIGWTELPSAASGEECLGGMARGTLTVDCGPSPYMARGNAAVPPDAVEGV